MVLSSPSTSVAAASPPTEIVVFTLDERDFALPLTSVDRVVRMVEPKPLPAAPSVVAGVVDVAGELLPLLDLRQRFRLPARGTRHTDSIVVAHTRRRRVALQVDAVIGLISLEATALIPADDVVPGLDFVSGIARLPGRDLVLIHDLERFLSLDEEEALAHALDDVT